MTKAMHFDYIQGWLVCQACGKRVEKLSGPHDFMPAVDRARKKHVKCEADHRVGYRDSERFSDIDNKGS